MDMLMSETCWAHKKWNKIASDIKLVFYSSTNTTLYEHPKDSPFGMPVLTEMLVFSDGKIAAVGETEYVKQLWKDSDFESVIDATGKCVLPGFVDAHTHPVWAGDRVHEFAMKVEFIDIVQILNIAEAVRCTEEDILSNTFLSTQQI